MVSVIQDKMSNYDTDVFTPIFNAIQEVRRNIHDGSNSYASFCSRKFDENERVNFNFKQRTNWLIPSVLFRKLMFGRTPESWVWTTRIL